MRNILVAATAGTLLALAGGSSLAQVPDMRGPAPGEPLVETSRVSTAVVPARLVLPNIPALTLKLMRSDRATNQKQLVASRRVVAFWENRGQWLRATRHVKCWTVPWQRSCTVARASYRLHLTLAVAAKQKLWRELPQPDDWVTAVRVIQRVFPGTESWLLSCSAAEGGHGRWVRYGGGSYYPGYEHTNQVGGWPQYRFQTFRGHYRHGLDALRAKGFAVDMPGPDDVQAWLMPMGHAIAAGWARWSHNDDSHWSASWGRGCS